jgi:hypothetical protein
MSRAQRRRVVGNLAQISALAGRIHRGAAFDADTIACGPDSGGREYAIGYSTLDGWRAYLERIGALVNALAGDIESGREE